MSEPPTWPAVLAQSLAASRARRWLRWHCYARSVAAAHEGGIRYSDEALRGLAEAQNATRPPGAGRIGGRAQQKSE